MKKEYVEESNIGHCLLEGTDITQLTKIVRTDFAEDYGFEIQAEFGNVQGYWNSIEELLEHKGLPNTPRELILNAWYPRNYQKLTEISESVRISFGSLGSYISVSGFKESWVIGKHEQIARFFEEKSRIKFLSEMSEKVLKSDFFASIMVGLCVIGILKLAHVDLAYAILFSISSTYIMLKYLSWAMKKIKRVDIRLKTRTRFLPLGMESKDVIPIIISILALVVSVIKLFK